MKYVCVAVAAMVMLIAGSASADQITLAWDYGVEAAEKIDGFHMYQAQVYYNEGEYRVEYAEPKTFEEYPDGVLPSSLRQISFNEDGIADKIQKYCWVIKAFKGEVESEKSNEVCFKVDNMTLMSPVALKAAFDKEEELVTLSWNQPNVKKVAFWKVFYRLDGEESYTELGKVENVEGADRVLSDPLTVVSAGEKKMVYFTVVAYDSFENYSENADEVALEVDRTEEIIIDPVDDLRIVVGIKLN